MNHNFNQNNDHLIFLTQVSNLLGISGEIISVNRSSVIILKIENISVKIGCAANFWFEAPIYWENFPANGQIQCTSEQSWRKLPEHNIPLTINESFNRKFLVFGNGTKEYLNHLSDDILNLFVANEDLNLEIGWVNDPPSITKLTLQSNPEIVEYFPNKGDFSPTNCVGLFKQYLKLWMAIRNIDCQ